MDNRRSIAVFVVGMILCVGLLAFLRGLRASDPAAALSGKLDQVVAGWTANNVAVNDRTLTLVIGDADAGEDVLSLPPEVSAQPSLWGRLGNLFAGKAPRVVDRPNPFTKAFAKSPGVVNWTFDGFSKTQEQAVIDELAKNIVKAHDAQAVINIVAQGEVGAAVLKSVRTLEGQVRGGVPVGANSVVLLGMNSWQLKAYDPVYFAKVSRPLNVGELANISGPGMRLEESTVEVFSLKYDGARLPGRYLTGLLPAQDRMSSSGLPIKLDALADAIIGVFAGQGVMEQWVSVQERQEELEAARRKAEEEARLKAAAEARWREDEEAKRRAAAAETRRRAQEAAQRKAEGKWPIEGRTTRVAWVAIPGGTFIMGSVLHEKPRHRVSVRGFQLAKTEVTNAQYRACVQAGACSPPADSGEKFYGDDQPVYGLDWNQAKAFSEWAGGRLPSEAEWEYAARSAGRDWKYPWGNEEVSCSRAVLEHLQSNCGNKSTWPVCSKPSGNTAQGLCDMVGNLWEWTQDWYHDNYNGAPSDGRAWESPTGSYRVLRGGSWLVASGYVVSTMRHNGNPPQSDGATGVRPAR